MSHNNDVMVPRGRFGFRSPFTVLSGGAAIIAVSLCFLDDLKTLAYQSLGYRVLAKDSKVDVGEVSDVLRAEFGEYRPTT